MIAAGPFTMGELLADGSAIDPECAAVSCGGCVEHQNEYPCNCFGCRGALSAVSTAAYGDCFHDGELSWWRCEFCRRYFDLEDMEILSGDSQACEPCVSAWHERGSP